MCIINRWLHLIERARFTPTTNTNCAQWSIGRNDANVWLMSYMLFYCSLILSSFPFFWQTKFDKKINQIVTILSIYVGTLPSLIQSFIRNTRMINGWLLQSFSCGWPHSASACPSCWAPTRPRSVRPNCAYSTIPISLSTLHCGHSMFHAL